jgi:hypothetical protein
MGKNGMKQRNAREMNQISHQGQLPNIESFVNDQYGLL